MAYFFITLRDYWRMSHELHR